MQGQKLRYGAVGTALISANFTRTRDGVNPGGACFAVPKNKERDSVSDRMASREAIHSIVFLNIL